MSFLLLFSRQGKVRMNRWYNSYTDKERRKILKEVPFTVCSRRPKMSNIVEWQDGLKLIYKRYASLIFCIATSNDENELLILELIHRYVELLDAYFGNVCELDIIFNFEKAYFILDELILGGYMQETSRKLCLDAVCEADLLAGEVDMKRILEEVGLYWCFKKQPFFPCFSSSVSQTNKARTFTSEFLCLLWYLFVYKHMRLQLALAIASVLITTYRVSCQ